MYHAYDFMIIIIIIIIACFVITVLIKMFLVYKN